MKMPEIVAGFDFVAPTLAAQRSRDFMSGAA